MNNLFGLITVNTVILAFQLIGAGYNEFYILVIFERGYNWAVFPWVQPQALTEEFTQQVNTAFINNFRNAVESRVYCGTALPRCQSTYRPKR